MTNAVTAGRQAGSSPITPPTPQQAQATWPRMVVLGVVLLALAVLALTWSGVGPRVLLGAIGLFGVVQGVRLLRGARTGAVDRTAALVGAGGVWLGALAMGVALLSAAATGWLFVVAAVVALPALAVAATDRRPLALGGAVLVAAAAVAVALLGGVDALLATARVLAAGTVGVLGLANLAGAVGMARIARRPLPAPAAGCGGCACGAGGCGS
ncbi:hypothetical protein GCM10023328_17680 [Modestobacter marinus]|uniref:Uncharacterized membrane protein HdeD (DUF308 family) n=1 Tax=Modestobacter marinus TaxID=477641 RepID=A0A846LKP8_9ACTN|nr:hypothetical protein [Modestobacter marinus]NIH68176.1 uncharacterized membrane protein HdeD (DUF308 family) [Modestobacter marinus]GGL79727.1 hypothetical protein GCM10011589_39940 [Modestobacter marinus]